ncbi:class I SAM-dependent methyltransferase [Pelagibacterales bacterium SAG-MED32]|nr:class I SAM-dependent methyltransferase [Pelagibacterales bacterium SAG-MED32]
MGVRDNEHLKVLKCKKCKFTFLNNNDHITENHYQESKMHENDLSMEKWISITKKDDLRRFNFLKNILRDKSVLDYGCGNGNFLELSKNLAYDISGIEVEERILQHLGKRFSVYNNINKLKKNFDVITSFHVLEHLKDPISKLKEIKKYLSPDGLLVIEVPNIDDVLIKTYKSNSFLDFTFWSNHLSYFNASSLEQTLNLAGFTKKRIYQIQRYPLPNHLYWLFMKKPGGHQKWQFLSNNLFNKPYEYLLKSIKQCDTLLGIFSPNK